MLYTLKTDRFFQIVLVRTTKTTSFATKFSHLYHYSLFVLPQLFSAVKLLYESAKSSCLMKTELLTFFLCLNSFNLHRTVTVEISILTSELT